MGQVHVGGRGPQEGVALLLPRGGGALELTDRLGDPREPLRLTGR